jgi:Spy/CpxP family protein refolding chaperone
MKRISVPSAWRYVAVGLAVSAAGAFGVINLASAHDRSDGPPASMMRGPGGMPGMPGMGLPLAGPMLERMLDDVKATDSQRAQLRQIAESAQADLKPTAEAARSEHTRLAELFAKPTVDPAAVEALRQQMLARHDQVTKRMNVAMLEASKVLTVEQRQQLVERMKQHEMRRAERAPQGGMGEAPPR